MSLQALLLRSAWDQRHRKIGDSLRRPRAKDEILEDKAAGLVVRVLPPLENQVRNKRVESSVYPCLDEGSIPSGSTLTKVLTLQK